MQFTINILCVCQINIPYPLPKCKRVENVLFSLQGSHVFWHWVERTGSAAKNSYQRKRCLTAAVKTFSSLSPPLFLSSVFFFFSSFAFSCCGVWQSSLQGGGATYRDRAAEFGKTVKPDAADYSCCGHLRMCVYHNPACLCSRVHLWCSVYSVWTFTMFS